MLSGAGEGAGDERACLSFLKKGCDWMRYLHAGVGEVRVKGSAGQAAGGVAREGDGAVVGVRGCVEPVVPLAMSAG